MSLENIQVREAKNSDASPWDDYIAVHKNGLAYHFFAWKQALEKSYSFKCPYFIAEKGRQIYGVLPTVHVHLPLSKGNLVSLPYCDVGGILADSPEIAETLLNYAYQYSLEHKIPNMEIRYSSHTISPRNSNHFNKNSHISQASISTPSPSGKVRMLLNLPDGSGALMASFKSKLRSQVNKAGRDGLITKLGGLELLEDFYTIFAENMRDLGSPVHSKNWLSSVLKYYGKKAKCGVVFMPDKTPAAAGIILCHNRIVSIPWASSLKRFNRFNPNMLLYWSFLKFASDNGYRFFDFGRSTPNEGTYKFKAQWGAKPQPLYWERWKIEKNKTQPKSLGSISHSTGRSRVIAENLIRKIPLPVATFLGSRLRKYISL